MSKAPNWEKLNREKRVTFRPSSRSLPATQKQLDYIIDLAHQKGQPKPRLPKTKAGASAKIDCLLALSDKEASTHRPRLVLVEGPKEPKEPKDTSREETLAELRGRFPKLTPMTVNSLFQLLSQVDELGMFFFFDALISDEEAPQELEDLIPYILNRFVEEFVPSSST